MGEQQAKYFTASRTADEIAHPDEKAFADQINSSGYKPAQLAP